MNDEVITVSGLKEVQRTLYQYSQQLGDRVVKGSLRVGANVVLKQARINAPHLSGDLRKGMKVYNSKIHKGKFSTDLLGVYIGISNAKGAPFWGKFQEDGWNTKGKSNQVRQNFRQKYLTTQRSIGSSRKTQRGKTDVPGKKFIDRAFIAKRAEAVDAIVRAATAGAEVLARKMGL